MIKTSGPATANANTAVRAAGGCCDNQVVQAQRVLGFLGVGATGATAPGTTTVRTVMPAARALVAEGRST